VSRSVSATNAGEVRTTTDASLATYRRARPTEISGKSVSKMATAKFARRTTMLTLG
jgi:hypothetical protein